MNGFTVADMAAEKLKEYFVQNNINSPLRVALMQGGCSGAALGLALDEQKDNDEVFLKNDLTFLIEKGLLGLCGSVNVEYVDAGPRSGFSITSANPVGGGGCGGSCSSGSCG
jgi:iron-sulfur cluster assembly accessory protein